MAYTEKPYVKQPYERKVWDNVPDPSNYEGNYDLNSLPRFDADNMNRIEDGIETALALTVDDIGALAKTQYIKGKSLLEVNEDGLYYGTEMTDLPDDNSVHTGFIKAVVRNENYRVVYWRPYNSSIEYTNVRNGDKWLGWSKIFTDKGGAIAGNIKIERDSVPMVELAAPNAFSRIMKNASDDSDGGLIIKDYADNSDSSAGVYMRLSHKTAKENLSEALKLALIGDGTTSSYNIFGEHNLPYPSQIRTGSYIGNGSMISNNPREFEGSVSIYSEKLPKIIVIVRGSSISIAMPDNKNTLLFSTITNTTNGGGAYSIGDTFAAKYNGTNIEWNTTEYYSQYQMNMAGWEYLYMLLY